MALEGFRILFLTDQEKKWIDKSKNQYSMAFKKTQIVVKKKTTYILVSLVARLKLDGKELRGVCFSGSFPKFPAAVIKAYLETSGTSTIELSCENKFHHSSSTGLKIAFLVDASEQTTDYVLCLILPKKL